MQVLSTEMLNHVAGGDYKVTVVLTIPPSISDAMTGFISSYANKYIHDTTSFAQAFNNSVANGMNFDAIEIESISFDFD